MAHQPRETWARVSLSDDLRSQFKEYPRSKSDLSRSNAHDSIGRRPDRLRHRGATRYVPFALRRRPHSSASRRPAPFSVGDQTSDFNLRQSRAEQPYRSPRLLASASASLVARSSSGALIRFRNDKVKLFQKLEGHNGHRLTKNTSVFQS